MARATSSLPVPGSPLTSTLPRRRRFAAFFDPAGDDALHSAPTMSCTSWAAAISARSWRRLRAQQRTFALDVHQSQFRRRAIRPARRRPHVVARAQSMALLEPRAQMTQHRAILGRERQAEIRHAAFAARSGKLVASTPTSSLLAAVHARAGCARQVVFVVRRGAAGTPHAQRAGAARGGGFADRCLARARALRRDVRRSRERNLRRGREPDSRPAAHLFFRWHRCYSPTL